MGDEVEMVNHIVGSTRTIKTAVLVVAYLRERCAQPHSKVHPDQIKYRFKNPNPANGYWSADIIIETASIVGVSLEDSSLFVNVCRAFVAGCGEVWA